MRLFLIRFLHALEHRFSAINAPQIQTFFQREKSEKAKYFLPGNGDSVEAKLLHIAGHFAWAFQRQLSAGENMTGTGCKWVL